MPDINIMIGDCMDLMKSKPDKYYDLAIVDPPYGIKELAYRFSFQTKKAKAKEYDRSVFEQDIPNKKYFSELFRVSKNQIIWGGNYFPLSPSRCWIVWDKLTTGNFADCELAWTSFNTSVRKFTYRWNGMIQHNVKNKQKRIHATEKPVDLYKWILKKYAIPGFKILDTYGGSMSHAIACYDLGFSLDIIEIVENNYIQAKKRFYDHVTKCQEIKKFGFAKSELSKINPLLF